jgi:membrane protein required for colicin V production
MILDIIIIVLIALAAWSGWRKGAITMLASIVILIVAVVIAAIFGTPVGKALGVGPTPLHPVTGFFILLVIIFFIGSFLKKVIKPKRGIFAGGDKLFGLIFGLLRAVLLLGLLFAFLRIFQFPSTKLANQSAIYPIVLRSSALMVSQLKPLVSQLSGEVYEDIAPTDSLKNK